MGFRCRSTKVVNLAYFGILWWLVAVILWLSDRLLCDVWKSVSFPYFHCGWHVFILLGSNIGCVLGCYFYAHTEHKELNSKLNFWPARFGTWGLPYIAVRTKPCAKKTWKCKQQTRHSIFRCLKTYIIPLIETYINLVYKHKNSLLIYVFIKNIYNNDLNCSFNLI